MLVYFTYLYTFVSLGFWALMLLLQLLSCSPLLRIGRGWKAPSDALRAPLGLHLALQTGLEAPLELYFGLQTGLQPSLEIHFAIQTGLEAQPGLHFGLPSALPTHQKPFKSIVESSKF